MGLFSRKKPKIKIQTTKKDGFSGWIKCSGCSELIHANELKENLNCCPKCDYHYRLNAKQRISYLVDKQTFTTLFSEIQSIDPLNFKDSEKYTDRLERAVKKSGCDEAIIVGTGLIEGKQVALGVLDFNFMGGSMGSAVGERITKLIEYAMEHHYPLILVSASGGARMQESILSLMQMAKTSAALARLSKEKIPYISILTNPTLGGVTASFAALGDLIIAEPNALIGFAGPRVVEQITKKQLPEKAQYSEFLLQHGLIDCIFSRKELRKNISILLEYLNTKNAMKSLELKDHQRLQKLMKLADKGSNDAKKKTIHISSS